MDALRATLMLLGLVIHSAQVYNPERSWLVSSEFNNVFFQFIVNFISSFRMPAFFIISGYFCLLILQKNGARSYTKSRFDRLLIPMVVGVLTLNVPLAFYLDAKGLLKSDLIIFFSHGGWSQHLWFLLNLFFYSVISALLFKSLRIRWLILFLINKLLFNNFLSFIFLLPFFSVLIKGLNYLGFPLYSDFLGVSCYQVFIYAPFFFLGILLKSSDYFYRNFLRFTNVLLLGFIYLLMYASNMLFLDGSNGLVHEIVNTYLGHYLALLFSMICFNVFSRFFNSYSKVTKMISDASYSIYVFHQPIIVIAAISLFQSVKSSFIGFAFLITVSFVVSMAIHYFLIKPVPILLRLYNGKG
jgi:glucan biosynthesis protein C